MKNEKIIWGLFCILAAIFLLATKMHIFAGISGMRIILAVFFIMTLFRSIRKINFGGIMFSLAFIGIIFDRQLGITALTPWTLLGAALLCTIGLSLLFNKKRIDWQEEGPEHPKMIEDIELAKEQAEADHDVVHYKTSVGAGVKYVNDFQYADLECVLGTMKVYFDQAEIDDQATIHLNVSFGAMDLYIPKTWNMVIQPDVFFGNIEEKNRNQPSGITTVKITGSVSFSALAIIYV